MPRIWLSKICFKCKILYTTFSHRKSKHNKVHNLINWYTRETLLEYICHPSNHPQPTSHLTSLIVAECCISWSISPYTLPLLSNGIYHTICKSGLWSGLTLPDLKKIKHAEGMVLITVKIHCFASTGTSNWVKLQGPRPYLSVGLRCPPGQCDTNPTICACL